MTMLAMTWGQWFLGFVLLCTCLLLILVILLQRGRGGGLAGAFGGAGGSSAFGAKTGDVFTWITVVVASVFVLLSIVTNYVYDESSEPRAIAAEVEVPPMTVPVTPTPAPSPDGSPPVIVDLSEDGQVIGVTPVQGEGQGTPAEGAPIKLERLDGPPPEIQKLIEEQQKKLEEQKKQEQAPPTPPADDSAKKAEENKDEEKKPEGAATP